MYVCATLLTYVLVSTKLTKLWCFKHNSQTVLTLLKVASTTNCKESVTQLRSTAVTGSAVALLCCKAHAKINRKIENLTPCKIVTHEDFNFKLGARDYVADITHRATLGSNWPSGGFPRNRGNITPM